MQIGLTKGLVMALENMENDELSINGIIGILKLILKEEDRIKYEGKAR